MNLSWCWSYLKKNLENKNKRYFFSYSYTTVFEYSALKIAILHDQNFYFMENIQAR